MIFNSFQFLIFFPVVLAVYYILPSQKYRIWFLLAASCYFYMSFIPVYVIILIISGFVDYTGSNLIDKYKDNAKIKRLCFLVPIVVDLLLLGYFKYAYFTAGIINFFGLKFGLDPIVLPKIILPIGISFHTFQGIGYMIDVYKGNVQVEKNPVIYTVYLMFFPQLVAGPIERPDNLLPQLKTKHSFRADNFTEGIKLILRGFIKKLVVADLTARFVNAVYNNPENATGPLVIAATVLFAFQIYCDFSGYTDIAAGCARMMGIKLIKNFDRPYTSKSIKEFWSRWHISLSGWFRDYLYIPLGGNRVPVPRYLMNIAVVFLLSGLWHGADWTFIIWGALHAFYQIAGYLTRGAREKIYARLKIDSKGRLAAAWKNICTFILVGFAWIFFRANDVSELGILLNRLFFSWPSGLGQIAASFGSIGYGAPQIAVTILSVYIISVLDFFPGALSSAQKPNGKLHFLYLNKYVLALWIIAFAWLILLAGDGAGAFIYFQF
ncbi:MAG: MBOAT family protein [Oscillospiraceae bacterium]|nr:MBOAT family protein [Oscillospiraceae bacterium]